MGPVATTNDLRIGLAGGSVAGVEAGLGQVAVFLTLEGLTLGTPDGRALPRLAESWQWENDDLRLRLFLRPKVMLHDGRTFGSEIAAASLRTAVTKESNLSSYPALGVIEAITADGPLQLVLDLSEPSSALPEALTIPLEMGADEGTGSGSVGAGPYRVVMRDPSELVVERFDNYYLGAPSIARVVVRRFDALRTAWTSLLRGEVNMVYEVPADAIQFISNDAVQMVRVPRWYQYLVLFNANRPPFSRTVRKALNLAINRATLVENVLHGRGSPATSPLWPQYWAYDASETVDDFDPAQAVSLLEEAGFRLPDTTDDPRHPPSRLRFTCIIPRDYSVWERIALEVQKDLFNIGVDMQLQVVSLEEWGTLVRKGNFEAAFTDQISGPTPARPYIFWRSARHFKGQMNVFGYENEEAERLFVLLGQSTNEAAVRSATRRLQRVLLDDPPALFLAWNERTRAVARDFVIPEEPGSDPIMSLWKWTRNGERVELPAP